MQAIGVGVTVLDGMIIGTICVGVAWGNPVVDVPCFVDVISAVSLANDCADPWVSLRMGVTLGAEKVEEPQADNRSNPR
jgi:hypothetical protein